MNLIFTLLIISTIFDQIICEYCYYREGKELEDNYLDCEYLDRNEPIEGIGLIHLKHNTTIPIIKKGLLSPFKNLKTLYITAANVEKIEVGALDNFKLEMLDLYHNNIKIIENGTFNSLGSLKYLDLSYNKFESVEKTAFEGLISLEWLSLNSNLLTSIRNGAFNDLKQLKSLYLAFNKISNLEGGAFQNLISLESIDLSFNSLTDIPSNLFTSQKNLQYLYMKHNTLESLPDNLFENVTNLLILDVSQNKIKELQENLFYNAKLLNTIKFNSNEVSKFNSTSLLEHAPNLQEVHLFYNQWKCADLKNITKNFIEHHVHLPTTTPVLSSNVGGIGCNE
ncbi:hypothetical protein ILUMI_05075 [Ignelater luminosus]|uniref:Uncharacterized protein n=1 Tax=Ignelater luminosus TaxID=2038154 RepID=A0A8K0DCM1_IGNLU|nr:hypothetical protein ILUMI_05075 [Ignelater luminosus]